MALSPAERRHHRARAGALRKHHPDDPEKAAADQRALRVDALERRIRETLDGGPGLDLEQRIRLARLLLLPGGDAA